MKGSAWKWVPSLYFAEGLPYFVVNNISVLLFVKLGMDNASMAFYTSLLYLPWVIKPLWSPFVDVMKTKRWWIVTMQIIMTMTFAGLCFGVNGGLKAASLLITVFYISAFASATHDIATDGFYMLALDEHRQSQFVGIRSTFYRIASVFGQGILLMVAGTLEIRLGDIPKAWSLTFALVTFIFALLSIWHLLVLPRPSSDSRGSATFSGTIRELGSSFSTFFTKKGIFLALAFMLLYRLPEAFSIKMLTPMLVSPAAEGGLGLSTEAVGLAYGTIGVIALTVGGILGGLASGRWGLRKLMWPMAMSLALPCGVYLYMAAAQPESLLLISSLIALDQFGYGFGFTAYMLYMMYFSRGRFATSHYALCTAFMALSMMLPGMVAGVIEETLGYTGFFVMVMFCCLATALVTALAARRVDPSYGKKA